MTTSFWKGKNALVCGASSGLGREAVFHLASYGVANIAILARSQDALAELAASIHTEFPSVHVHSFASDLCQADQVTEIQSFLKKNLPELDLAINAIGKSDRGTIQSLNAAKLSELHSTNVVSGLHMLQATLPHLKPRQGCIVLIGSLASLFAPRFLGGYALAKHSVAALAQQARLEFHEDRVHVMLACPGPIRRTDAGQRYQDKQQEDLPDEALQPGGGAKISGLDPKQLLTDILFAAQKRKSILIRPRSAQLLHSLSAVWPSLAESILRKKTS